MQRLPNPRLVTDSMGAGGVPHVSYGMSAPGSTPVEPSPQLFETPDITDLLTPSEGDDRNEIDPGGARDPVSGQFQEGGGWSQAGGHGFGGWRDC